MTTFDLDPYNSNIHSRTNDGLKLFLKSTEECKEDVKLKFSQLNVINLMSAFESDARKFGWSALVNIIPSEGTGQHHKSILNNFSEVTTKMVKQ